MAARVKHFVLLVEDEPIVRMNIAEELREAGFGVVECFNADDAVRVLTDLVVVNLVLTDIVMPGSMDGLGLIRWIRANRPRIKVAVSSGTTDALAEIAELCEPELIFPKPARIAKVVRAIREALGDATPSTSSGAA